MLSLMEKEVPLKQRQAKEAALKQKQEKEAANTMEVAKKQMNEAKETGRGRGNKYGDRAVFTIVEAEAE